MVSGSRVSINPYLLLSFVTKSVMQFSIHWINQAVPFSKCGLGPSEALPGCEKGWCRVLHFRNLCTKLAAPSSTLKSCPGTTKHQLLAFESTVPGHYSPSITPRTSGRMNCSTGLYHSLFTCTPQLGGLKRATKRASYKWEVGGGGQEIGGKKEKKKDSTLDIAYSASFQTSSILGSLILDGPNRS